MGDSNLIFRFQRPRCRGGSVKVIGKFNDLIDLEENFVFAGCLPRKRYVCWRPTNCPRLKQVESHKAKIETIFSHIFPKCDWAKFAPAVTRNFQINFIQRNHMAKVPNFGDQLINERSQTNVECPHCRSPHVVTKNYAKKAGGAVGTVAGTAAGATGALSGAEIGAMVGLIAGPVGSGVGGLAGAIFGGLFGGAIGCAAGTALGEIVDNEVLDNYQCLECSYSFSKKLA